VTWVSEESGRGAEPCAVTITWPDYRVEAGTLGGALRGAGLEPRLAPKLGARTPAELTRLLVGAVGAIVSTDPFDAAVLRDSPDLRVIARVGVGTDSIDLAAATERGVVVTVTPGANEATVAEHTIALMLALSRRICEQDAAARRGEWNRTGPHLPGSLHGSTVGLVGYGRIGRLVAERLRGFDVRILATDPSAGEADPDVELVALPDLLAASDVVSLHAPLEPSTAGLIGVEEIRAMRTGAMLVNTARGGMVDERALLDALLDGHLGGAALDVFAEEPPAGNGLLGLPNVVATAHVAGLSERSIDEMTHRATASVVDVVAGRRPADVANPAVFDHPSHA
jgi:phosphoglycerate dehydrogenase-like enzyme